MLVGAPCHRNPDLAIDPETGEPIEAEAPNDVSDSYDTGFMHDAGHVARA